MEMIIDFPHGAQVDAHFGQYTIKTDQAMPVGEGSAPTPFAMFLASIGTCAGIFVLSFCQQRQLSTDGIRIVERIQQRQTSHLVEMIELEIQVPASFPAKYYDALVRAADQCAVKRHLENPPQFNVHTTVV